MIKSAFIGALIGTFAFPMLDAFFVAIYNRFICEEASHQFEDSLEEADALCEIGYTFQRNEISYKKISGKKWFAEILIPDDDQFEIGCELMIENYIYKKLVKRLGLLRVTIEIFLHIVIPCLTFSKLL